MKYFLIIIVLIAGVFSIKANEPKEAHYPGVHIGDSNQDVIRCRKQVGMAVIDERGYLTDCKFK